MKEQGRGRRQRSTNSQKVRQGNISCPNKQSGGRGRPRKEKANSYQHSEQLTESRKKMEGFKHPIMTGLLGATLFLFLVYSLGFTLWYHAQISHTIIVTFVLVLFLYLQERNNLK